MIVVEGKYFDWNSNGKYFETDGENILIVSWLIYFDRKWKGNILKVDWKYLNWNLKKNEKLQGNKKKEIKVSTLENCKKWKYKKENKRITKIRIK